MTLPRTARLRPGGIALFLIAVLCCPLFATSSGSVGEADSPNPYPTTKAEDHDFVLVSHYHFTERDYQPQVVLPGVGESPAVTQSPEEVLISQFSAIDALDFDWWLKTWDGPSAQKIKDRMAAQQRKETDWRKQWEPKAGKMRVTLTRWLLTGDYVVLVYKITPVQQDKTVGKGVKQTIRPKIENPPEISTVFHLWNGTWRATLDLENDPVVEHFADTNTVYQWTVRPLTSLKNSRIQVPSGAKVEPADLSGVTKPSH